MRHHSTRLEVCGVFGLVGNGSAHTPRSAGVADCSTWSLNQVLNQKLRRRNDTWNAMWTNAMRRVMLFISIIVCLTKLNNIFLRRSQNLSWLHSSHMSWILDLLDSTPEISFESGHQWLLLMTQGCWEECLTLIWGRKTGTSQRPYHWAKMVPREQGMKRQQSPIHHLPFNVNELRKPASSNCFSE